VIIMKLNKNYFAAVFGNVVEWFDFFIYGYLSMILAQVFFPSSDPYTSLMLTFGTFAVGFLMRPLGGLVLGYWGDKIGRKKILLFSVILMGCATVGMGLLPGYATLGVWASVGLVVFRLIQGFAAGGEISGAMIYSVEHSNDANKGLVGSFTMLGVFFGLLLSSVVGFILSVYFSEQALVEYAWRIPFLFGGVLALLAILLRHSIEETPKFRELKSETHNKQPLSLYFRDIITVAKYNICPAVTFYLVFVFLVTYFNKFAGFDLEMTFLVNTIAVIWLMILTPLFGLVADKIGHKKLLIYATIAFALFSYPLLYLISYHTLGLATVAMLALSVIVAATFAPLPAIITQLAPVATRYTSVAFGFNLSAAIFGGAAPILVIKFSETLGGLNAAAWIMITASVISFFILLTCKADKRRRG
jgi:MHS family proline/betaine transporter-like MFS transporter